MRSPALSYQRGGEIHDAQGDAGALEDHAGEHEYRQRQQRILGQAGVGVRRDCHHTQSLGHDHRGAGDAECDRERRSQYEQQREAEEQDQAALRQHAYALRRTRRTMRPTMRSTITADNSGSHRV